MGVCEMSDITDEFSFTHRREKVKPPQSAREASEHFFERRLCSLMEDRRMTVAAACVRLAASPCVARLSARRSRVRACVRACRQPSYEEPPLALLAAWAARRAWSTGFIAGARPAAE